MKNSISLSPIAYVKGQFHTNTPVETIRAQSAQIVVKPEYVQGLMGLDPGQDILVIFYFDQVKPGEIALQLHPRHDPANPLRGVFATRTQFRPNRLGASVARIEKVEANVMTVTGLDALDNTPVVDIKPLALYFDAETYCQQFEVRPVNSLQEARETIDLIDAEIIRLLGNRAGDVHQVVNYKNSADEIRAPIRYAEVMRGRRELAEAAGLNADVIEAMYTLLVENFIKEELEILRRRERT